MACNASSDGCNTWLVTRSGSDGAEAHRLKPPSTPPTWSCQPPPVVSICSTCRRHSGGGWEGGVGGLSASRWGVIEAIVTGELRRARLQNSVDQGIGIIGVTAGAPDTADERGS
eukprot:scaffold42270_cov30-Tisochrysis_lutea.AAC.5